MGSPLLTGTSQRLPKSYSPPISMGKSPYELGLPKGYPEASQELQASLHHGKPPTNWVFLGVSQELQASLQHGKPLYELGLPRGFPKASQELQSSLQHGKSPYELGLPRGFSTDTCFPSAWKAPL
ncbi:hypothetical protein GUJ93_ZPchr0005g16027 [Zizania palustris]|uniref:Uncharacterized protein n=1 Tax=Zizania palustris TaxID=103762 RepID=A0A8J5VGE5_ZIZPA|nr:hypothetical protein GUJ93_ZPchr0005g16027 [Zizania palustris]